MELWILELDNVCIYSYSEFDGLLLDYSRQCATVETLQKLLKLAEVGLDHS